MKKYFLLSISVILFIFAESSFAFSADVSEQFISPEIAKSAALMKLSSVYDGYKLLDEHLFLYGLDDSIYAYMFIGDFTGKTKSASSLMESIDEKRNSQDEKNLSMVDEVCYIIISARYENNVILEYGRGVPYALSNFFVLKKKFNLKENGKLHYLGHGRFFYEDKEMLFDLAEYKTYNKIPFKSSKSVSLKWKLFLEGRYSVSNPKSTAYIPGVPFVLWSYGCSPTTSSMIFSYYDSRGYGDFVDYYFTRFDNVMGIYRYNVPSAQRELSVLMNTDSINEGGTSVYSIKGPNQTFANTSHPYSFTCGQHVYGQTAENFFYPYIKQEVDSARPAHWAVLNYYYDGDYIGHSVVSIGYDDSGSDTLIQIHNTWDYTEPFWNLYTNTGGELSYSCFYEIQPAGGNSFRKGNISISGKKYFKNLKGAVTFANLSDSLNSIKLYYSTDNFASKNFIGESYDTLFVLAPPFSGEVNFSAEFFKAGGGLLATDGTYSPVSVVSIDDTHNLQVLSYTYDNSSAYSSLVFNDTLILLSSGSISEYSISDASMPQLLSKRSDSKSYKKAVFINDSVMVAGTENEILTIKRKNGYSDIDTFSFSGSYIDMDYKDNVVFLVTPSAFYAVNVNGDYTLSCADTFSEGSRKQYTSVALKDSFIYLTDLLNGIHIMKSLSPSTGFYDNTLFSTPYSESYADIMRDTLYLACIGSGVSVYELEEDGEVLFIANYGVGTVNRVQALSTSVACFNNSLGVSLRRYSTLSELSRLYMNSKISDVFEKDGENKLFFSDNSNGLFIGSFDPYAGVKENPDSKKTIFFIREFSGEGITIEYSSKSSDFAKVEIFDLSGRLVESSEILFRMNSSKRVVGENLKSGVYFVKISRAGVSYKQKTTLIK